MSGSKLEGAGQMPWTGEEEGEELTVAEVVANATANPGNNTFCGPRSSRAEKSRCRRRCTSSGIDHGLRCCYKNFNCMLIIATMVVHEFKYRINKFTLTETMAKFIKLRKNNISATIEHT